MVHPKKPGEYVLAVACDGAAYHSAATARDRDRLRQQVLEGLGWKVHRIWSTDWWYERQRETDRLLSEVARAVESNGVVPPPKAAPVPATGPPEPERIGPAPRPAPAADVYRVACLQQINADPEFFHDPRSEPAMRRMIAEVVAAEAPLHLDVLTRRVVAAFGGSKATAKARRRVSEVMRSSRPPIAVLHGEFVWDPNVDPMQWSQVRAGPEGRDIEEVAPEELAAAASRVLRGSLSLPEDELVRETARLFRIQRVGKKVAEGIGSGIALLVRSGRAARDGSRIVHVE